MARADQSSHLMDSLLYNNKVSYAQLPAVCEELLRGHAKALRVKVLISEIGLALADQDHSEGKRYSIGTYSLSRDQVTGELEVRVGRNPRRKLQTTFTVIRNTRVSKVWLLLSDASSEMQGYIGRYYSSHVHPRPATPVFRTEQIQEMLKLLETRGGAQSLRIRQAGHRTRIHSEGAEQSLETDRKWTDLASEDWFGQVREAHSWITDISFTYTTLGGRAARMRIGRYGDFKLQGHAVEAFQVIDLACVMALERYAFLREREKSRKTSFRGRPFRINFARGVIRDQSDVKRLHSALLQVPNTSCTLLHGNPYFHVTMTDYEDGSSYEVISVAESYVVVVPQGRATVRALTSLCRGVFSNFQEGTLAEVENEG